MSVRRRWHGAISFRRTLFNTLDRESSGIIPAPSLGAGAHLVADQNHTKVSNSAQVERSQLLVLNVPPGQPVR